MVQNRWFLLWGGEIIFTKKLGLLKTASRKQVRGYCRSRRLKMPSHTYTCLINFGRCPCCHVVKGEGTVFWLTESDILLYYLMLLFDTVHSASSFSPPSFGFSRTQHSIVGFFCVCVQASHPLLPHVPFGHHHWIITTQNVWIMTLIFKLKLHLLRAFFFFFL